jgi:hypothetical protein
VLAITGRKHLKVDPDDVERIGGLVTAPFDGRTPRRAHASSSRARGGHRASARIPAQLKKPVDPGLVEQVAAWIESRS